MKTRLFSEMLDNLYYKPMHFNMPKFVIIIPDVEVNIQTCAAYKEYKNKAQQRKHKTNKNY